MLQFFLGALVGGAVTYFGSDVVADNCSRAMWASEQTLKNKEMINQKALEQIAEWAYNGQLQEKINALSNGQMIYNGVQFQSA